MSEFGDIMPTFVCQKCRSVDNTALTNFWAQTYSDPPEQKLCSACDPEIGEWHDKFPRTTYDGTQKVSWVDGNWVKG